MSLALPGCIVIFLSLMAFWKESVVVFMLAGGASMVLGLHWFDVYVTDAGLGISLVLICYSLVCFGFGYKCMFVRKFRIAGDEE